jgi:hypothetical protein
LYTTSKVQLSRRPFNCEIVSTFFDVTFGVSRTAAFFSEARGPDNTRVVGGVGRGCETFSNGRLENVSKADQLGINVKVCEDCEKFTAADLVSLSSTKKQDNPAELKGVAIIGCEIVRGQSSGLVQVASFESGEVK